MEESVLISEGVLISGVKLYTHMAFRTAKSVLFIEVSSFQGVLIGGVQLCTKYETSTRWACSNLPIYWSVHLCMYNIAH